MINTLSPCTKKGNMLSQAYKGLENIVMDVCRIIYNIFIFLVFPNNATKVVYAVIFIPLVILYIWAFMWFACALDDQCYYSNVGV